MARVRDTTRASFRRASRRIRRAIHEIEVDVPASVRIVGEEILTDVKASRPGHGVPVDRGILRGSGQVEGPTRGVVSIRFGGAAAPYALVQHERLDFYHTVGEPRYLVRGVERWRPKGSAAMTALRKNARAGLRTASNA